MGNNRSYSKGCKTCVKRRVRCDERNPTCLRCEKGGFDCEGFKEATFVDAKAQVMRRFASKSKASPDSNTLVKSNTRASSRQSEDTTNTITRRIHCRQVPESKQPPSQMLWSPNTSPFRDEMYVLYTVDNLRMRHLAMMYWDVLPSNLSGLPHQSMMNQCLLAIAKVFYGRRNRDRGVLEDGMRLYGRGLSMLNKALGKANCNVTTEMIVSVFLLCIGESIMPSSKSSWMTHILGLERMFALHGPLMTEKSTIFDHFLLESCRPLMILGAFFTQRPSSMDEPKWNIIALPQGSGGRRNLFQTSTTISDLSFLLGILAQLPRLFLLCNRCIRLTKAKSVSDTSSDMIWIKVDQLQQELQAWKEKWSENHQSEIYEILPVTTDSSVQLLDWQTVFDFSSVELAKTFTMYHTVVILLAGIPTSLIKAGLGPPVLAFTTLHYDGVSINHSISDIRASVRNICRTTDYYIKPPEPLQVGADYYVFFPMHVARRTSNQWGFSSELVWLADTFEVMKSKYSMGLWANMNLGSQFNGCQDGLFG